MEHEGMSTEYERVVTQITIKPKGEPIFHELATKISIDDEAAGPFVVVSQSSGRTSKQEITVDVVSWEPLKNGIDEMIRECLALELTTK